MKRAIAALLLFSAPVQAQVSSTAAPVANSSGSVTNQAVQVVPSRQFAYTYGGGISCQGATFSINPFISTTTSWAQPYEAYYDEPIFDTLDITGAFDSQGNSIPDGRPDNPGAVLYMGAVRRRFINFIFMSHAPSIIHTWKISEISMLSPWHDRNNCNCL